MYRLQINPVSRSDGRRATASAAYRAGERIHDERSGRIYDHSNRRDVLHSEIMLPSRFAAAAAPGPDSAHGSLAWARDRATLWNAAEKAERRRNSRVAREYQVNLPFELAPAQRVDLARAFSREIADRYNVVVDLAIHEPKAGGDPRNHHAHILTTTREVTLEGLGAKTGLDMNGSARHRRGLVSGIQELVAVRARWATLANEALREAGVEARIDHRSLEEQGIDRAPRAYLPWAAYRLEQRGLHSEVAERIRERVQEKYQARVAAYRARTVEHSAAGQDLVSPQAARSSGTPDASRQAAEAWLRHTASQPQMSTEEASRQAAQNWLRYTSAQPQMSEEEARRQAVQKWLRYRQEVENSPSASRDHARVREHEQQPQVQEHSCRGRHNDLGL